MKVIVTCDVDEEMLKKVSGCEDCEEAVQSEFGWLTESGINPMRFDFGTDGEAKEMRDAPPENREYAVRIEETLAKVVYVNAADETEAAKIVSDKWRNGDYVLDADCFVSVNIETLG